MVGLDGVHDVRVLPVPAREVGAYERMRPLVLMGHGLSQIVEEGRALAERDVETELSGDESREVAALDEVREHVLTVRRAVVQRTDYRYELGVEVADADAVQGFTGGGFDALVDGDPAALERLFDPLGVDAPVGDQLLQRDPGSLTSHGVERGEQDASWGVVDQHVDARHLLERADVAALSADDAALHVLRREVDRGHHGCGGLVRREPLHRRDDDLGRLTLRGGSGLLLDVAGDG